jgi:hypothetical protein
MTAEEFLRSLASRAEIVRVAPSVDELDEAEDVAEHLEDVLVIRIDPEDADEFLSLTGIRVT